MLSEVHRNFPVPDITGPGCREFHRRYPRQTVGQTGKPLQVPVAGLPDWTGGSVAGTGQRACLAVLRLSGLPVGKKRKSCGDGQ